MKNKTFIGFLLVLASTICQAQNVTKKTISFVKPELQVDSTFIEKLNTAFFDNYFQDCFSKPEDMEHLSINFTKDDDINYYVQVSLSYTMEGMPKIAVGYSEHYGFTYWFCGDVPPSIILETKAGKRFSYTEYITKSTPSFPLIDFVFDPPVQWFEYNIETGSLTVVPYREVEK